jgi:hypothetical protein
VEGKPEGLQALLSASPIEGTIGKVLNEIWLHDKKHPIINWRGRSMVEVNLFIKFLLFLNHFVGYLFYGFSMVA